MNKIKIFLASSEELKQERLELADFVEHLNHTLEKVGLQVQLVKWEYLDSSMGMQHKQEDYNDALKDCEMCIVIYWTRFGMYTKTELDTAYNRLREGANPQKLYVYFKNEDEKNSLTPELKEFRDSFPKEYGHFENRFSNIDTLKSQFLLQFIEYQSKALKGSPLIEVKDGKISMGGKTYVDLMNVPFVGNNEDYTELLEDIEDLKEWLDEHEPDHRKYAEKAAKLREKEEKKEKMETSLWDTALDITRLSNQKCSERLQRAIDLFNKGDNKGANAILNEEEIYKDAENNINLIKLGEEGKKGLKTNIEELKLKVKTLENEMSEGWGEEVVKLYEKIIEYTNVAYGGESEEFLRSILDAWQKFELFGKYDKAKQLILEGLSISEKMWGENHKLTAEFYNDLGAINYSLSNFDEAIKFGTKALEIQKKIVGEISFDVEKSYDNLGNYYEAKSLFDEAIKYSVKSYNIQKQLKDIADEERGLICLNLGYKYIDIGDFNNAILILEEALDYFIKSLGENHYKTSEVYKALGTYYRLIGDKPKALLYTEKTFQIQKNTLGLINQNTADCLNQLGLVNFDLHNFEISIEYYLQCIEILSILFGNENQQLDSSYSNLGLAYESLGNYVEAKKYILKAIDLQIKLFGEESDAIATSYENLASLYRSMGDLKNAEKFYIKSLDIFEKIYGESHFALSTPLFNLSNLYNKDLPNYEKAKKYAEKAINISIQTLGENHPETAFCFVNLASILRRMGDMDEAYSSLRRGLETSISVYGENHGDVSSAYNEMGFFHQETKDYEKSICCFKKAIEIDKKIYGLINENTIQVKQNLCLLYLEIGDKKNALELVEQMEDDIFNETNGNGDEFERAKLLDKIGYIYGELGEFSHALGLHLEALDYYGKYKQITNVDSSHEMKCLKNIAWTYEEMNDFENAIKFRELELNWNLQNSNDVEEIAISYDNVGSAFFDAKNYEMSISHYLEGLKIRLKKYGVNNENTATSYHNLGRVCFRLGNYEQSLKYTQKLKQILLNLFGNDSTRVCSVYNDLGSVYRELKDYEKALEYRLKGLEWHLRNSEPLSEEVATAYNNVGAQYRDLGEYDKALEYIGKAYEISKETDIKEYQAINLNRLGRVYALMGDKDAAKAKFEEALSLLPEDHPDAQDTRTRLEELESAVKKVE